MATTAQALRDAERARAEAALDAYREACEGRDAAIRTLTALKVSQIDIATRAGMSRQGVALVQERLAKEDTQSSASRQHFIETGEYLPGD